MNISQHCFIPRTYSLPGKYYSLTGDLKTTSRNLMTTEKQTADVYNCFQLFGSYLPVDKDSYVLRLFDPVTPIEQGSNYVGKGSGFVSPQLVKKSAVFSSSAFTSLIVPNGLKVSAIMWFE